ncbi:MAG: cytochrome c oxidase subunit II [Thauera sp.]|nr:cytochrome c oxidase subunit II [Thauera sp.]
MLLCRGMAACAGLSLLTGCDGPQSALQAAGPAAREAAQLWWGMLTVAVVVLVGVVALWVVALRRQPPDVSPEQARRITLHWLVWGGLALPGGAIVTLLAFGIPAGQRMLPLPLVGEAPLRVVVTGHQWRWEVHYPDGDVRLTDELHLPADRAVDVEVRSADVIHSFWVPRLAGKIDMVPGRSNLIRLRADAPGEFRGQCAEYCGTGHAFMVLRVVVHDEAGFDAWLESAQEDA